MKKLKVYSPGAESTRRCGACSKCCTTLGVKELGKPEFVRCDRIRAHTLNGSCSVYAARPESCKEWLCMWLRGFGENRHKPSKSGLVLDIQESAAIQGFVLKVFEVVRNAHLRPSNKQLIEGICEAHPRPVVAILFKPGGKGRVFLGGNPQGCKAAAPVLDRLNLENGPDSMEVL